MAASWPVPAMAGFPSFGPAGLDFAGLAEPATVPRRAGLVLHLQRQYGNQAVQRLLRRRTVDGTAQPSAEEDGVRGRIEGRAGGGQPLEPGVRGQLEQGLGANLSGLRVHSDGEADALAQAVDAVAFTSASDIFFRAGAYQPASPEGLQLLAHEAAHAVQQAAGPVAGSSAAGGVAISDPSDTFEQAAERTARAVAKGGSAAPHPTVSAAAPSLQRQAQPEEEEEQQAPVALQMARPAGTPVLQRDGPPPAGSGAPPSPAPPTGAPAADQDAKALEEREQKALDAVKARAGQPVIKVLFSNPAGRKQPPDSEQLALREVKERPPATPKRPGFDSAGPATAYAALQASDTGAVVVQQDGLYFAASLAKGQHELSAMAKSKQDVSRWDAFWDWFKFRDYVYRVDPASGSGTVSAVGKDGFSFPLGHDLNPEPQPGMYSPQTVDANAMRAMAGITPEGTKPGEARPMADQVAIPEAQQETFILSYFRARANEALADNEKRVKELRETFRPTDDKSGGGISDKAKGQIDAAYKLRAKYRDILDREGQLGELMEAMAIDEDYDTEHGISWEITTPDGEKKQFREWVAQLKKQQAAIAANRLALLSQAPLLAQLVQVPRGPTILPAHMAALKAYDESLIAKPRSAENDEAIRAAFVKKLDAVSDAIFDTSWPSGSRTSPSTWCRKRPLPGSRASLPTRSRSSSSTRRASLSRRSTSSRTGTPSPSAKRPSTWPRRLTNRCGPSSPSCPKRT